MKKKSAVYLLIILLLLSSCQPTPNEEVIVNKADNDYTSVATTEANPFSDIPSEYTSTFASDNQAIVVNINSTVSIPDIDNIPIATLVPRIFTQNEIDSIISTLMQNQPLYEPRTVEDYSKDEIEEIILKLESGEGSDLYLQDKDAYFKQIKEELDKYKKLYETAPEEGIKRPASTELKTSSGGKTYVNVTSNLGKKEPAYFSYIDRNTQYDTFTFCNTEGIPPTGKATSNLSLPNVVMSVEDAQKIAEEAVEQFNLGDFTVNGVASVPYIGNSTDYSSYEGLPKCYMFYFTRSINGLNETYINPEFLRLAAVGSAQESAQYNFVWPTEVIDVAVDDTGILSVYYIGPPADIQAVYENVKIMSFDDIIQKFKDQILISYPKEENIAKTTVNINRIVFGGTKIINQDGSGKYLFVPTWDFFGSVTSQYKEGTGDQGQLNDNNEFTNEDYGFSIMTINALDGSIINRYQGY